MPPRKLTPSRIRTLLPTIADIWSAYSCNALWRVQSAVRQLHIDTPLEKALTDLVDVRMTVNGVPREGRCEPRKLLVDFLREDLTLTGTHAGCEHGICGACTILFNGEAARSCTTLAVQADGAELITVEGLANGAVLHPLQEAFRKFHGLQCGFCTPGMLITAIDFLNVNPSPTEEEVRDAMSAVICRCTGYQGIVAAVLSVAGTKVAESR